MTRELVAVSLGVCLLAIAPVGCACADDLPARKAGLWDVKATMTGAPMKLPPMAMQQCTDDTVDKMMTSMPPQPGKPGEHACVKDFKKTASGYVNDSVCDLGGMSATVHSEVTGDLSSAYTLTTTTHVDLGSKGGAHDMVMKIESKWLGACKPDQRPGDVVSEDGPKFNVKDILMKAQSPPPAAKQ